MGEAMNGWQDNFDYIKECALDLKVGESKAFTCCFCNREKKLSVTRVDNGILYNCFRASCSGKGIIGSISSGTQLKVSPKEFKPRAMDKPLRNMTEYERAFLMSEYCLSIKQQEANGIKGFGHAGAGAHFAVPLFYKDGKSWGWQLISKFTRVTGVEKKVDTYKEQDGTTLHYARSEEFHYYGTGVAVLVEDVFSAMRVSNIQGDSMLNGIALLGTTLNDEKVRDIRKHFDHIIVALDPDATTKGYAMKERWGLFFDTFSVSVLEKDPKDYTLDKELFKDLVNGSVLED